RRPRYRRVSGFWAVWTARGRRTTHRCSPRSRNPRSTRACGRSSPRRGPGSASLPRPLASRRSDAPSSLLAALVSPGDAAPLPLAPSALPRPLASRRSDAPSSLLAALVSPDAAAPLPLAPSVVLRVGVLAGVGVRQPLDRHRKAHVVAERRGGAHPV